MLNEQLLELYWSELPTGKENAVDYPQLCDMWGRDTRTIRSILHDLSLYDNGDDYVLIRSGKTKGFYKTDDKAEIEAYRKECLNKGRSIFAPVKKCNRILRAGGGQADLFNNLRTVRDALGMKQKTVCKHMKQYDKAFDVSLLSKMENGVCLPNPMQLSKLAEIYGCEPSELVGEYLYSENIFEAI
jgi:hypothetical protein